MQETLIVCNDEEWRPVAGYEGIYAVSTHGRIMRIAPGQRTRPGLIRKPVPRGDHGYLGVRLRDKETGREKSHFIQVLVAAAFLGPKPPGMQVNHLDANKHNNRLDNLEYVTPKRNVAHALAKGTRKRAGTGRCLSPEEVNEIRAMPRDLPGRVVAERYGTSHTTIFEIWNSNRWKCLDAIPSTSA